jgi:predicted neuraminidase
MDEPTYYSTGNGEVHLIIRDNSKSGFLLRAISYDQGRTFTQPVRTNYTDATSKNFPGRLRNGQYFLINNPNPKGRDPLAISFSRDGWMFRDPLVIRRGQGSFQYPHAIEHGGKLWVIYSTNKRNIDLAEMELPR